MSCLLKAMANCYALSKSPERPDIWFISKPTNQLYFEATKVIIKTVKIYLGEVNYINDQLTSLVCQSGSVNLTLVST